MRTYAAYEHLQLWPYGAAERALARPERVAVARFERRGSHVAERGGPQIEVRIVKMNTGILEIVHFYGVVNRADARHHVRAPVDCEAVRDSENFLLVGEHGLTADGIGG